MTLETSDRGDRTAIEEGNKLALAFDQRGLLPVVTTCASTGKLLMQAWANPEAIEKTLQTGEAWYYSRSRGELWHKGATSGEIQKIIEVRTDCDQDSLQYIVDQQGGGCCHTGRPSCFYRIVQVDGTLLLEE